MAVVVSDGSGYYNVLKVTVGVTWIGKELIKDANRFKIVKNSLILEGEETERRLIPFKPPVPREKDQTAVGGNGTFSKSRGEVAPRQVSAQ